MTSTISLSSARTGNASVSRRSTGIRGFTAGLAGGCVRLSGSELAVARFCLKVGNGFCSRSADRRHRSLCRDGRGMAGRGANGTLGMDRRDLDLCDGACRLCPRAVARLARRFATISLSPASQLCGLFAWASTSFSRTARGGDDPRYQQLRVEWGDKASGQAFLVSSGAGGGRPCSRSVDRARPPIGRRSGSMFATRWASSVFGVAIFGESTADRQLARFGRDPKNKSKICDVGLWGLSRHPNYFFEWLVWVAFALIAIAPAGHYPWGWFGLAAPVLMYVLLVHVSGIPPLEAHMLRSRGDAFRLYQVAGERILARTAEVPRRGLRIREPLHEPHHCSDAIRRTRSASRRPLEIWSGRACRSNEPLSFCSSGGE